MNERRAAVGTIDDRASRTFVLEQRIRYCYAAPIGNLRQRLKVVPPAAHGEQLRRNWQLTIDGVESSYTRSFFDSFGNVTIEVTVPRVDAAVEFRLEVEASGCRSGWTFDTAVDRRYLRRTRLTAADDAIVSMAPVSLASGGEGPDIASLCARVHGSLDYEWGVTDTGTTASEALAGGRGVCQDYAHIMVAACRSAGVAARYVSGHLAGEGGSHAWVEILRPHPNRRGRWLADGWDPTHNRRADSDYLVIAVGRDYADAAPLSGCYDANGVTNTLAVTKRLDLS